MVYSNDTEKLEDLIVLINEKCGNPKVAFGGEERTRNIDQKKEPCILHAIGESISSISIWNIVNQPGKYDFSCMLLAYNLKERQIFSDQINRNCFDLILATRSWNCSIIENLRCLNYFVN